MNRTLLTRFAVTFAVVFAFASASVVLAASHPDFSGTWKLNKDLSDNPREKMKEARKNGTRGGFGPGMGGVGSGGPGMGGVMGPGGGFGGGGRYPDRERRTGVLDSPDTMQISGTDAELIVDYNGRQRHLFTDGRTVDVEGRRGEKSKVRTNWKGDRLEVATTRDDGREIVETFELNAQTGRLSVTLAMDRNAADDESMSLIRIYDRSPASTPVLTPGQH